MVLTASYLLLAYFAASFWEATFHRTVLHARQRARRSWRKWGAAGSLLRLACFYHHTIHHRSTFLRDQLVQFDSALQQGKLDSRLRGAIGSRVRLDRYGLTVTGPSEFAAFVGPPLLVNSLVALALAPGLLWMGAVISTLPLLLSRYLHPLLHEPIPSARRRAVLPALRRGRMFRFVQSYHLLHHAHGTRNFNLLLGADWLLGQSSWPGHVGIKQD